MYLENYKLFNNQVPNLPFSKNPKTILSSHILNHSLTAFIQLNVWNKDLNYFMDNMEVFTVNMHLHGEKIMKLLYLTNT